VTVILLAVLLEILFRIDAAGTQPEAIEATASARLWSRLAEPNTTFTP